jgi:hypothetical protein
MICGRRLDVEEPPPAMSLECDAGRTNRRTGALPGIKAIDVPIERLLESTRKR